MKYDKNSGIFTQKHGYEKQFDRNLAAKILELYKDCSTISDIGCGDGYYIRFFNDYMNCIGYEGNKDINPVHDNIIICDLTKSHNLKKADLVISLEVGEHIPHRYMETYLKNVLDSVEKYLVISWAIPGQGGIGHVNCLPNETI